MKSRVGWTPFDGMPAQGRAVATIVRGRVVMRDGEVQGSATGEPVRFMETLAGQPIARPATAASAVFGTQPLPKGLRTRRQPRGNPQ